jgi:hypothetical protein
MRAESADFMISSPLMDGEYDRLVPDYDQYRDRRVDSPATGRRAIEEHSPNAEQEED